MYAERVMGIADNQYQRVPSSSQVCVESKVKAQANNTITWLDNLSKPEQNKVVKVAMFRSRLVSSEKDNRKRNTHDKNLSRMKQHSRKRTAAERRNLEKAVKARREGKECYFGRCFHSWGHFS